MASVIFPRVSLEVTPREKEAGLLRIEQTVKRGLDFDPLFIDLSFGGGGRPDVEGHVRVAMRRTIAVIRRLSPTIPIVPHITRTGLDIASIRRLLAELTDHGIYKFMLVGGDTPKEGVPCFPKKDCYAETIDLIADVCAMFARWGLANKLELLVGVEPEGSKPVDNLKNKIKAGVVSAPAANDPISTVQEAITQYYTKTGIIMPFLAEAYANDIDIQIVAGIALGAGVPEPRTMINPATREVVTKNGKPLLIDLYGAPLHPEYLKLFEGFDPADKSARTLERLAAIHKDVSLRLVGELAKAKVDRIHGYTNNRQDFFDILEAVYPGIASKPAPAGNPHPRPALSGAAIA